MSQLAGHKEFAVSSDLSLLGRTVDIYMLNGEAVGSPVASAGEIYYTFADAQELKAVCDSNSFTFADDCSYYSNFEPATADILSSLPENAKITVIDLPATSSSTSCWSRPSAPRPSSAPIR